MRSEFLAENLPSATWANLLGGRVARIHTSVPIKILGRYVIFRKLAGYGPRRPYQAYIRTVNRPCQLSTTKESSVIAR